MMVRRFFAALITVLVNGCNSAGAAEVVDGALGRKEGGRACSLAPRPEPRGADSDPPSHVTDVAVAAGDTFVVVSSVHPDVGVLEISAANDPAATEIALAAALSRCRDRGHLKVWITLGAGDEGFVRRSCERHGFIFSRTRSTADGPAMEFYADLYYRPQAHREALDADAPTAASTASDRA
jgi:hypothetical protein